tara:strand:- start:35 stop:694 length:660 start_codon:yes stop_codon:yes gene_type:complete
LKYKDRVLRISCDGGAATGKSTGGKLISKKYNLKFLSSGLLYRYAAYLILKFKPKNKIIFLKKKFNSLSLKKLNMLNLHTQTISEYSAVIAKIYEIRKILKKYQTNFAKKNKNCCIEGRDIGTVIMKNADIKFFFTCNLNTASKRRFNELRKKNPKLKFKEVKKAMRIRNNLDRLRTISPLIKPKNAVIVPTDKLKNIKGMIKRMSKFVDIELTKKYGN